MSTFHLLDANGHPAEVNHEDVLAIRPTSNGPEFHTKHGVFYYPTTLEEFQALLGESGFERLDRGNLVNMVHAKSFDRKSRKVYFEEPWTSGSFYVTVSEANTHKVMHLVKEDSSAYQLAPKPLFWSKSRT